MRRHRALKLSRTAGAAAAGLRSGSGWDGRLGPARTQFSAGFHFRCTASSKPCAVVYHSSVIPVAAQVRLGGSLDDLFDPSGKPSTGSSRPLAACCVAFSIANFEGCLAGRTGSGAYSRSELQNRGGLQEDRKRRWLREEFESRACCGHGSEYLRVHAAVRSRLHGTACECHSLLPAVLVRNLLGRCPRCCLRNVL
jgi:hypothetical protein